MLKNRSRFCRALWKYIGSGSDCVADLGTVPSVVALSEILSLSLNVVQSSVAYDPVLTIEPNLTSPIVTDRINQVGSAWKRRIVLKIRKLFQVLNLIAKGSSVLFGVEHTTGHRDTRYMAAVRVRFLVRLLNGMFGVAWEKHDYFISLITDEHACDHKLQNESAVGYMNGVADILNVRYFKKAISVIFIK